MYGTSIKRDTPDTPNTTMATEKTALLSSSGQFDRFSFSKTSLTSSIQHDRETSRQTLPSNGNRSRTGTKTHVSIDEIVFRRHISLLDAMSIIIGGVAGSGIFISPTGVTASVGSVGASLIIWTLCGLSNIVLALCYAELGSALPLAGGDYAYVQYILGPLPAFLCLWVNVMMIGPVSGAIMARTISLHLFEMLGLGCQTQLLVATAVLFVVFFAFLNIVSVRWAAMLMTFFSLAKLLALGIIIITGAVYMANGHVENIDNAFEGTNADVGSLVGGFLPGFVAYVGWDCVNTLVEELKNPARDLPLSVTLSMGIVTLIYVLTNLAYFSVLTTAEFIASDAVAMTFAAKSLPALVYIVPVAVALAAAGSVNGLFLVFPRAVFAGAQDGHLPAVLSYLHISYLTPAPAVIFLCILTVFFTAATFFEIQSLLAMLGVVILSKMTLTLIALLYYKCRLTQKDTTVKVHPAIIIICTGCLITITGLALYQDPVINGFGMGIFVLGIPMYFAGRLCAKSDGMNEAMDQVTRTIQRILLVVPSTRQSF